MTTLILGNSVAAPGRRRRRDPPRRRPEGAGAHNRRDAALLRGRPDRGRQAGGGRGVAQSHRRRRPALARSPTTSISAIRKSPRSWASSSAASTASAKPAARSTSRSCRATSRSTMRAAAGPSRRRPRSAASGSSTTSAGPRRSPSGARARTILLDRRRRRAGSASRCICAKSAGARRARRRRSISPRKSATAISCAASIRTGAFVRVHDISDGGLAVALAEMAIAGGVGARDRGAGKHCRRTPSGSARIRRAISSQRRRSEPARSLLRRRGRGRLRRLGETGGADIDPRRRDRHIIE